jgi:hypothetical protein
LFALIGGQQVDKLSSGFYRCKVCGAIIDPPAGSAPPRSHLATSSGGPMYRVVTIGGQAVHQCQFPPPDIWHDDAQGRTRPAR